MMEEFSIILYGEFPILFRCHCQHISHPFYHVQLFHELYSYAKVTFGI